MSEGEMGHSDLTRVDPERAAVTWLKFSAMFDYQGFSNDRAMPVEMCCACQAA
jgi:hypothetical protein